MSWVKAKCVVDAVVIHYFLLSGEEKLLLQLVGSPIMVPRIVFDPDDDDSGPERNLSEIGRGIRVHQRRATEPERDADARAAASSNAKKLARARDLASKGRIETADLTDSERAMWAHLQSRDGAADLGLRFPLGSGEAACIAIADSRDLVLATDDTDALRALDALRPDHPYERIGKLLKRAADSRIITRKQARAIYADMCQAGFWGAGVIF